MAAITVLLLLVSILGLSSARPGGAPLAACDSLMPAAGPHGAAQTTPSPYTLMIEGLLSDSQGRYYYEAGQTYNVTLRGTNVMFQGFLVQLRLAADQSMVANQLSANSTDIQQHMCATPTAGFTHTSAADKDYIRFQWTPSAGTGAVVFRYTVVQTQPVHWDALSSNTIYEDELRCQNSTTVGETFLYWTARNLSLEFIMRVPGFMNGSWTAVGFSMNRMMAQTDIVVGAIDGSDYFVDDRFATARAMPPRDTNQNLRRTAVEFLSDGRVEVRFTRPLNTGDSQDFDLNDNCFYLLVARGQVGNINTGVIMQHSTTNRGISMERFCFCSSGAMITGLSVWLLLLIAAVQYLL